MSPRAMAAVLAQAPTKPRRKLPWLKPLVGVAAFVAAAYSFRRRDCQNEAAPSGAPLSKLSRNACSSCVLR